MSFNKTNQVSHDNCFVTSEDLSGDIDEQISTNHKQVSEVALKSNKRKKHRSYQNDEITFTYDLESSDFNNKNTTFSEKQIKKLENGHVNGGNNEIVQPQQSISIIAGNERLPSSEKKRKSRKSLGLKSDTIEISVENGYISNGHCEEDEFCTKEESLKGLKKDNTLTKRHDCETNLEDFKQNCQERIDFLLKQSQTNDTATFPGNSCEESTNLYGYENIERNQGYQMNCEGKSLSEDQSIQSSVNSLAKPKRKRKHAKKKKRESQYLSAVGPLLSHLVSSNKEPQPSPSASEIAKHVFFTDEDFADEMPIPPSPIRAKEAKQADNGKRLLIIL